MIVSIKYLSRYTNIYVIYKNTIYSGHLSDPRCHIVIPLLCCVAFTWLVPVAKMSDDSAFAQCLGMKKIGISLRKMWISLEPADLPREN